MEKVTYGVQLYGCTEIFRKNPDDFFKRAAKAGCELIEPCVTLDTAASPEGATSPFLTPAGLEHYAKTAKKYGLRIESCHLAGNALARIPDLNKLINRYGIRHVMTGGPPGDYHKMFDKYTQTLQAVAGGIRESGARLCIHNGPDETRRMIGGKTFLEAALEQCGGAVGVQFDVGWALAGGVNPFDYMRKIESRLLSLHYKDIKKGYQHMRADEIHVCLGEGCLDNIHGIFDYARKLGVPQLIDQDKSDGDIVEDLEKSIGLLRSFE